MTQTHFAFTVVAPGHALDGADVIIAADDEADADRIAALRSTIYAAPLHRAVPRTGERSRGAA